MSCLFVYHQLFNQPDAKRFWRTSFQRHTEGILLDFHLFKGYRLALAVGNANYIHSTDIWRALFREIDR